MRALAAALLTLWLGLFGRATVHHVAPVIGAATLREACAAMSPQEVEDYNDTHEVICPEVF